MKKGKMFYMAGLLLLFLLTSCSKSNLAPSSVSIDTSTASPAPETGKQGWEKEWTEALHKARAEAKVVILATYSPTVRKAVSDGFTKSTGISVEIITGRGEEIAARLRTERRAGLYIADVYMGGANTQVNLIKPIGALAPLRPAIFLPDVLNPDVWFQKRLPFLDKEEQIFIHNVHPGASREVAFNTQMLKEDEVKTYRDLLKPAFKGKMNIQDPTIPGKGSYWFSNALKKYKGLDLDFMRGLAKQEPVITRDKRIQVEWIAQGKHLVSVLPDNSILQDFLQAGAPLTFIMPEEAVPVLTIGFGSLSLMDKPAHPYAARLFVNWILSREGQITFARGYDSQSARVDVPFDFISPENVRDTKVSYSLEDEDFIKSQPELEAEARKIFGPLLK